MAQGVPGRLRSRIFSTFGTTRVVGRQQYAPAAFTPGETLGTHFQMLSRPQGTWFCWEEPTKKSPVTPPGIDPGTVRLVALRYIYIYTWSLHNKIRKLISVKVLHTSLLNTTVVAFKVLPLGSYAPMPAQCGIPTYAAT